ncbi:hypothetical protein EG346_03255 [Chryseobacterium carnipullorum]|uniref:Uncharacterized protein n=1 Tax=Chryseobacterium carnipullorum TaxID=1124835 RepID=A0A3G6NLL8_CHRCU|nr:hypothetical protein EG346_03255 [Chryseobacterium carnipullorum]AZA66606.1 hypothetical protein EG345_19365 [Chryseobacterium carnipullorum]
MKNMYYLIFILLLGVFCCEYDILYMFKLFIKIFILQKYFNNFIDILIGRLFSFEFSRKIKNRIKEQKKPEKKSPVSYFKYKGIFSSPCRCILSNSKGR